jgi:hypothetical protein
VGSGIFKGIRPVGYRSTLALEPTKFSSKSSQPSQLPDGFMAHLRYGECASYLQFLKEICFTLFISPLHFRKFSPLTHNYFNNETTIMVAGYLAPIFSVFFRVMLKSLGSRFLPIRCVTVRLRLPLMPVVVMFDLGRCKRSCLFDRCRGMKI